MKLPFGQFEANKARNLPVGRNLLNLLKFSLVISIGLVNLLKKLHPFFHSFWNLRKHFALILDGLAE